ncbi:vitamin B12 ABC transporter ATP-binding protein BtuD [Vibrio sinaloensis]|uniref:vitamin B12 ABC transporter ATP-binding protein BtuD n=1 Tax=Photobacterium sp. (strain ATCC 43367) TaxID=379097 RepID=UPI0035E8BA25
MIRINNLSVAARLLPLSLTMNQGEVLHVIGPNGSGKSTFLSAIAGLIPFKGDVQYANLDVRNSSIESLAGVRAFLSQSDRPAFNLIVAQYLALSVPKQAAKNRSAIDDAVAELAQLLDLSDKLHRPIHHLSGGEWQRVRLVAICLQIWPTLNSSARVLILDEPAAPLDIGQESLLYQLIQRVAQKGISVVMSNHDLNRTLRHADSVILLDKGVLQQHGTPDEVLTEAQLSAVFHTQVTRSLVNDKPVLVFD